MKHIATLLTAMKQKILTNRVLRCVLDNDSSRFDMNWAGRHIVTLKVRFSIIMAGLAILIDSASFSGHPAHWLYLFAGWAVALTGVFFTSVQAVNPYGALRASGVSASRALTLTVLQLGVLLPIGYAVMQACKPL